MSSRFRATFPTTLLVVIFLIAGCSDKSSAPSSNENLNLTDAFGGYKATNESPAFGDPEIMGMAGGSNADDDMMGSHLVDSLNNLVNRNVYSVQLAWGHLQYDSLETAVTDWSGSLAVERGAIVAIQLIGFEAGDHIVRPRMNPHVLEFVSHTREYYDGMLVYIYDPQNSESPLPNHLMITTPLYSHTYSMDDLDSLSEVVDVGNNQFSINAFRVERLECGEGYLDGKWVRNGKEGNFGQFMGRWISKDGLLLGHFKGHWGIRDDSTRVLFGKWIGAGDNGETPGVFKGLLRGTWGVDETADPNLGSPGWLKGDIFNRDLTKVGEFDGTWSAVIPNSAGNGHMGDNEHENGNRGRGHGFLRGEWQQICE